MRSRTFLLLFLAFVIAGGTAFLTSAWLKAQRPQGDVPVVLAPPAKSVLVARTAIRRGQILRPDEMVWQVWPEGALDKNYIVKDGPRTPEAFAGWVAQNPIAGGDPITETKIIAPGDRGYLAAVLRPGMRAISVQVTATSGISGFIFPGDSVDLLLTYNVPPPERAESDKAAGEKYQHRAAQTVLRNLRVIAIDQRLESKAGEAVQAKTATFEVSAKNSEIILLASEIGKLSLILRSLVPGPDDTPDAEPPSTGSTNTDPRASAITPAAATTLASMSPPAQVPVAYRGAGSSSEPPLTVAQAVTVIPNRSSDPQRATAPSGGPRVVTPSDASVAASATYTIDNEVSKLFPQPKGEKETLEPPKLWVCKGPNLSCSNPASAGERYLEASQQAERALGEMARQKAVASGGK